MVRPCLWRDRRSNRVLREMPHGIASLEDADRDRRRRLLDAERDDPRQGSPERAPRGRFIASTGSAVVMTFKSGSRLEAKGETFGVGISPKFEANVVDVVYLSWMGGPLAMTRLQSSPGAPSPARS